MTSFFFLTCHVDLPLRQKIKWGEFVELEKLLPRTHVQVVSDDQKMHFVNWDGASFWVPAERESRITGIRKWDQAFRIYAAIYSKHNHNRSAEIWQYIHVINTAAVSYIWENVNYYDLTFRRLMHERPNRSWAKTYVQLWNLAMCDPISKANSAGGNRIHQSSHSNSDGHSNQTFDWHDRCCWRFNRGEKCKKWNCRYDHRCKNCGSWNHSSYNCPKKIQFKRDDSNFEHKHESR